MQAPHLSADKIFLSWKDIMLSAVVCSLPLPLYLLYISTMLGWRYYLHFFLILVNRLHGSRGEEFAYNNTTHTDLTSHHFAAVTVGIYILVSCSSIFPDLKTTDLFHSRKDKHCSCFFCRLNPNLTWSNQVTEQFDALTVGGALFLKQSLSLLIAH